MSGLPRGYESNNSPGQVHRSKKSPNAGGTMMHRITRVPGPFSNFLKNIKPGFNRSHWQKEIGIGDDSAVGSLFEDEALIIPDPHLPIRLKQGGFFEKNNSNNKNSDLWHVIKYGGAYTSLRLRSEGIPHLPEKGKKGLDIEVDYTLIDSKHHIIYLVELKKGKGAQAKGDAIQLNRAAVVLSYHYQKIHKVKPAFKCYFVAGTAIIPENISFFGKSENLSTETKNFNRLGGPFIINLMTAKGFAQFLGLDWKRVQRIIQLPRVEQTKFNDTLLLIEKMFINDISETSYPIEELMKKLPADKIPDFWKSRPRTRVERLEEIDLIPGLIFKKRLLEQQIKRNISGNKDFLIFQWAGIVKKLASFTTISDAKRAKYKRLTDEITNKKVEYPVDEIDISEQIILRHQFLGAKAYAVHPVEHPERVIPHTNLTTNKPYLEMRKKALASIIANKTVNSRTKLNMLTKWGANFTAGRTLTGTTGASKTYTNMINLYNTERKKLYANIAKSKNNYNSRINSATNNKSLNAINAIISSNNRLNRARLGALRLKVNAARTRLLTGARPVRRTNVNQPRIRVRSRSRERPNKTPVRQMTAEQVRLALNGSGVKTLGKTVGEMRNLLTARRQNVR
jgi:hypothetical protein